MSPGTAIICSAPHSGSTLLCGALGSHPVILGAGGLLHWTAWQASNRPDHWVHGLQLFKDGSPDYSGSLDEAWYSAPPSNTKDVPRFLREHFKKHWVVDTSKNVKWYQHLLDHCSGRFLAINLYKTAIAYVSSIAKHDYGNGWKGMSDRDVEVTALHWLAYNGGFRHQQEHHPSVEVLHLAYTDLATDPEGALKRITELMDLPPHISIGLSCTQVGGNTGFKLGLKEGTGIRLDPNINAYPEWALKVVRRMPEIEEMELWLRSR